MTYFAVAQPILFVDVYWRVGRHNTALLNACPTRLPPKRSEPRSFDWTSAAVVFYQASAGDFSAAAALRPRANLTGRAAFRASQIFACRARRQRTIFLGAGFAGKRPLPKPAPGVAATRYRATHDRCLDQAAPSNERVEADKRNRSAVHAAKSTADAETSHIKRKKRKPPASERNRCALLT